MTISSTVARVAAGSTTYTVNPYRKTAVPTRYELHLMNRMGCGYSRTTWAQLRSAGGAAAWFEAQLRPGSITESALARDLETWFPGRHHAVGTRWQNNVTDRYQAWEYARDLGCYTTLKRMYSRRSVLETMVDFWSNHFHIKGSADLAWVYRDSYDKMLRRQALGRFDALLEAVTLHPAMLLFLDNWQSVRDRANENHGRELLELHTVGRTSGYTEAMVKDSATILSGWTVDARNTWKSGYDPQRHTLGPVQVLGFTAANGRADGSAMTKDYLRYLAHHPATARTIARKLAVRFVSDQPSAALVDDLAQTFSRSGTDIRATLRALVQHPEFRAAAGAKVRTPVDDLVHTTRVLGIRSRPPQGADSFARTVAFQHGGDTLYSWPRPDGAPEHDAAWTSASRMLGSFYMHWNLAGGYYPKRGVVYRSSASWLPQRRIRFDQYVDHLCRLVLGRPSTPLLLQAAVQAVECRPAEVVHKDHRVATWLHTRLMAVLLDSPEHMTR